MRSAAEPRPEPSEGQPGQPGLIAGALRLGRLAAPYSSLAGYAASLISVALVTGVIAPITEQVRIANVSMVYLVAVIAMAVRFGKGPAVLASVAAFLAFDFCFVRPLYTFTVSDPSEWVALLLFLLTAIITGQLAAGQRLRALEAEAREHEAALLYDVARLLGSVESEGPLRAVAERLRSELDLAAVVIELEGAAGAPGVSVAAGLPAALRVVRAGGGVAASRLLSEGATPTATRRGAPGRWVRTVPQRGGPGAFRPLVVPIKAAERRLGSLIVVPGSESTPSDGAGERLLGAVAAQIGSAGERDRLRREATEAEALRRADELKTALLNAVSHDLRTPLASIIAAAGSLQQTDVVWTDQEREEFAEAIEHEAGRLNTLVGNLLDLSRIESGSLRPDKGWYDLGALIDEVLGRLKPQLAGRSVDVALPPELPPIALDYIEIDETLTNLIENAVKYTPSGSPISIKVRHEGGEAIVEVADRGRGLPEGAIKHIFEPFFRVGGSGVRGTGLGLAVAKGLIEAHGGRIWADNRPEGGARFVFTLPLGDAPAPVPEPAAGTAR